MPMRKLTLSLDPKVIELAKRLASERGTSVSEMFSQFIRSVTAQHKPVKGAPKTRLASGLVKLPRDKTDRQLIEEGIAEKFLR